VQPGGGRYSDCVNAAELGKALLARVRASTPPHDDELTAQIRFVHDHLREKQGRVLMTVGQFAAPLVMVPAFYLSLPVFVGLVGATLVGAGRVVVHTRRRNEEVRELARNAKVGEARALSSGPRIGGREAEVVGAAAFEIERAGRAYLRIEVRDGDVSTTARLMRERPRGFSSVSVERIPVLYAPHSNVVIAFDTRGEMMLGKVEAEPLPRAMLR
jgi:hypothetical protein